mgnify:FL=1
MKTGVGRYWILCIGALLFMGGIFLYCENDYQRWIHAVNEQELSDGNVILEIRDNYTGLDGKMEVGEFLKREDSLEKLKVLYQKLNESTFFSYQEIMEQSLEFLGYCELPVECIPGEAEECRNQDYDGTSLTPLNSIQVSEKVYEENELEDCVKVGRGFTEKEYVLDDSMRVKVLLGADYQGFYQVGDEFEVFYLAYGKLTCEVDGFLEEGTAISRQDKKVALDAYILMPALCTEGLSEDNAYFEKVLYSVKTNGYAICHYENERQYTEVLEKIQQCFAEAGVDYRCEDDLTFLEREIPLSKAEAVLFGVCGVLAGIIAAGIFLKKMKLSNLKGANKKTVVSFRLRTLACLFLCGLISYGIAIVLLKTGGFAGMEWMIRPWIALYLVVIFAVICAGTQAAKKSGDEA